MVFVTEEREYLARPASIFIVVNSKSNQSSVKSVEFSKITAPEVKSGQRIIDSLFVRSPPPHPFDPPILFSYEYQHPDPMPTPDACHSHAPAMPSTTVPAPLKVGLVGGGLGGLAFAISLQRAIEGGANVELVLYEGAHAFAEIGAGESCVRSTW